MSVSKSVGSLMQLTTETRLKGRAHYRTRAWLKVIAANPREGRIQRAVRRAFIAHNPRTMRELRSWAYPGRDRQHWHQTNIYRALAKLGARRIGWGAYAIG
jgi:hypothetical protein